MSQPQTRPAEERRERTMPVQWARPWQAEELRELRRGTPTLHWVEPKSKKHEVTDVAAADVTAVVDTPVPAVADADNAAVAAAYVTVVADAADKVIVISLKLKAFRSSDLT